MDTEDTCLTPVIEGGVRTVWEESSTDTKKPQYLQEWILTDSYKATVLFLNWRRLQDSLFFMVVLVETDHYLTTTYHSSTYCWKWFRILIVLTLIYTTLWSKLNCCPKAMNEMYLIYSNDIVQLQ